MREASKEELSKKWRRRRVFFFQFHALFSVRRRPIAALLALSREHAFGCKRHNAKSCYPRGTNRVENRGPFARYRRGERADWEAAAIASRERERQARFFFLFRFLPLSSSFSYAASRTDLARKATPAACLGARRGRERGRVSEGECVCEKAESLSSEEEKEKRSERKKEEERRRRARIISKSIFKKKSSHLHSLSLSLSPPPPSDALPRNAAPLLPAARTRRSPLIPRRSRQVLLRGRRRCCCSQTAAIESARRR